MTGFRFQAEAVWEFLSRWSLFLEVKRLEHEATNKSWLLDPNVGEVKAANSLLTNSVNYPFLKKFYVTQLSLFIITCINLKYWQHVTVLSFATFIQLSQKYVCTHSMNEIKRLK